MLETSKTGQMQKRREKNTSTIFIYAVKYIHVLTQYGDLICYMKLLRLGLSTNCRGHFLATFLSETTILGAS